MSQKRSYKQYSREYKEEAVALVLEQGYSVPKASESLGISPNMLYKWKEKFDVECQVKALPESERAYRILRTSVADIEATVSTIRNQG